jgi:hypothetical protein
MTLVTKTLSEISSEAGIAHVAPVLPASALIRKRNLLPSKALCWMGHRLEPAKLTSLKVLAIVPAVKITPRVNSALQEHVLCPKRINTLIFANFFCFHAPERCPIRKFDFATAPAARCLRAEDIESRQLNHRRSATTPDASQNRTRHVSVPNRKIE